MNKSCFNELNTKAIDFFTKNETDFTFLYLGYTDMAGHSHGWTSEQYMAAMENRFNNINRLINKLPDDYVIIVTADMTELTAQNYPRI